MSHTPGPWVIESDEERGGAHAIRTDNPARWGIASVWHQSGGSLDGDEDFANARLIAASPKLLAALEDLCGQIQARVPLDTKQALEAISLAKGSS